METEALQNEEKNKQVSGNKSSVPETANPVDPPVTSESKVQSDGSEPESKEQSDGSDEKEKQDIDSSDKVNFGEDATSKDKEMMDMDGLKPPANGSVDPLEVPRRVANEVERSTKEKTSSGEPETPKSQESQPMMAPVKEASPEPETETKTIGSDHKRNIANSQVSEVAQVSEIGVDLGFDLNEEVGSEETDIPNGTHIRNIDLNVADESEESCIEPGPVKLQLDLNNLGDGSANIVSSTASSMKNIDLNLFNVTTAYRDVQHRGDNVISLFGTQLGVTRQDPVPNWAGCGLGVYGPNTTYFMSPFGLPGAPNPYMVDPRGLPVHVPVPVQVPVAPHLMGLSPGLFQQAPPFMGWVGPGQHNFDLNNNGGSSSGGEKRKEPEGGWEGFPVTYKR